MQENNYIVYMHKNKINGKVYIGITYQNVKYRWRKNGVGYKKQKFYNAIKKYGWDNFEHIILFENLTFEESCLKEQELIKKYNSNNKKYGYNHSIGGDKNSKGSHWIMSEEAKEKDRQAHLGKKNGMYGRKGAKHPNYGKPLSEETKRKMSEKLKGHIPWNKGKKLTEEHKLKVSIATKKAMQRPEVQEKLHKKRNVMKKEIIKELQYFNGIKFHEKQHFYTLDNYRFGISATSLIETYAQEFDSDSVSQIVANKRGISQQEVLEEWKKENEFSCIKGSCIHLKAQSLWMGTDYEIDYNAIDNNIDKERLKKEYNIMSQQAINFYNDYKDMYDMIQDEFIVWSKEFDIAGSIDGIMYNKYTQQCCILDFKSNKDLQFESKYHKKMKVPLHKLDDINGQHHYIQLSIYKYLIEKYTNIKVDELFIVYFNINANNYEIIPIPYMEKEVKEILELRRIKNMQSIAVLLIGGSGTGKTCSFRNMPANETAIINVTNKPLPYKDKGQKVVSTKDYTQIISAIKGTKKRALIIDDSGYLMSFENFDKANIKSYDKFTTMAQNYYKLIEAARDLDNEKICYIVMHEEVDEDGKLKPKAIGKMLNQQLCIEGLFTIVLRYKYENGQYLIQTKTDGSSVVKSPIDLFEENEVPNDLYEIDKKIRDYYGFKQLEEKVEVEK